MLTQLDLNLASLRKCQPITQFQNAEAEFPGSESLFSLANFSFKVYLHARRKWSILRTDAISNLNFGGKRL